MNQTVKPELKSPEIGNRLIAEFMGAVQSDYGNYMIFTVDNPQHTGKINHNEIFYDVLWSWLMPVVEKIGQLPEVRKISIELTGTKIWLYGDFIQVNSIEGRMITHCYSTVVTFLNRLKLREGGEKK